MYQIPTFYIIVPTREIIINSTQITQIVNEISFHVYLSIHIDSYTSYMYNCILYLLCTLYKRMSSQYIERLMSARRYRIPEPCTIVRGAAPERKMCYPTNTATWRAIYTYEYTYIAPKLGIYGQVQLQQFIYEVPTSYIYKLQFFLFAHLF